jgi:hypothetical protein
VLSHVRLADPGTHIPFPTPIPRSAFPTYPDPKLSEADAHWRRQIIAILMHERLSAQAHNNANNYVVPPIVQQYAMPRNVQYAVPPNVQYSVPSYVPYAISPNVQYVVPPNVQYGMSSGQKHGDNSDHASVLDTVNTLGTLANTILAANGGLAGALGQGVLLGTGCVIC